MTVNRLPALLTLIALLLPVTRPAVAESDAYFAADPNSFTLSVKNEVLSDMAVFHRAFLSVGTNKFAFVVPKDFRIESVTGRRITLANKSNDCFILVRFLGPQATAHHKPSPQTCRHLLLSDHPGSSIEREFTRLVAGLESWGFEMNWNGRGRAEYKVCALVVPSVSGLWVYELISRPKEYQREFYNFNFLLLTAAASRDGKLEFAPLSDKL